MLERIFNCNKILKIPILKIVYCYSVPHVPHPRGAASLEEGVAVGRMHVGKAHPVLILTF